MCASAPPRRGTLSQLALGHRCTNAGLFTALMLYDMANAFPSLARPTVTDMLEGAQPDWAHSLLQQHHAEAGCFLKCPEGQSLSIVPADGVLPGSSVGTLFFNHSFRRGVLEPWLYDGRDQVHDEAIMAEDFCGGTPLRVDVTVYVDDIARRYVASAWSSLVRRALVGERALAECARQAGLQMNGTRRRPSCPLTGALALIVCFDRYGPLCKRHRSLTSGGARQQHGIWDLICTSRRPSVRRSTVG